MPVIDMADYMKNRRQQRRNTLIEMAGGCCYVCDSIDDLEFDHRDRTTKSFNLSGCDLDRSWEQILVEFEKCDLYCSDHHRIKTVAAGETGGGHNKRFEEAPHGVGQRYATPFNCRCGKCREWKHLYRNKLVAFSEQV